MFGGGGGGGLGFPLKAGGGILGLIVAVAALFLPKLLSGNGLGSGNAAIDVPSAQVGSPSGGSTSCSSDIEQIVCGAVDDVQAFWQQQFQASGQQYTDAPTVFFSGQTQTGCGVGDAQTGPFYCPADGKAYFDLDFLQQLQSQFGATGDLAAQYIVAHEYGHHIQNLLGISAKVSQLEQQNPSQANAYSVRLELQADCLAGVWVHNVAQRNLLDNPDEINEALNAASAVGDDRIQSQAGMRVDPDSFTHGTSEQRRSWFNTGFQSGNSSSCDTFSQ
jgi:predicted metalloprotease